MVITTIIIIFLTFNLAFLHRQSVEETRRLHHVQREFMIQTLSFFIYLGIIALIFCRVERYTYVQSLYFMVVTTLTIGFGDIAPKTTAFKVLTFPFTIIGITLLALIVTSIVQLLADRARRQKAAIKMLQKEKARAKAAKAAKPSQPLKRTLTLQEELIKLREEEWIRERRANLSRVVVGLLVFLVFWFIGAVIFHLIEVYLDFWQLIAAMDLWKRPLLLLCILPDNRLRRHYSHHRSRPASVHCLCLIGSSYNDDCCRHGVNQFHRFHGSTSPQNPASGV